MQTHDVLGATNSAHPVTRLSIAAAAVAACLTASVASAATVTINTVNAPETVIPGLTAFATTGANMVRLPIILQRKPKLMPRSFFHSQL